MFKKRLVLNEGDTYLCNCSEITSTVAVVNGVAYLILPPRAIPFPKAASSSWPGV